MRYDPILCMNVDDSKKAKIYDEAPIEVIVSSYNSTAGKRYSLVTKKEHRPLHYAPSGWKTKEGAKKWAEKNGFKYVGYEENLDDGEKVKAIDKAIKNCDSLSDLRGATPVGNGYVKDTGSEFVVYDSYGNEKGKYATFDEAANHARNL